MAWNRVISEIDKIESIVKGWEKAGGLNIMEQDLVLDKLRAIYDEVKFAGLGLEVQSEEDPGQESAVEETVALPEEPQAESEPVAVAPNEPEVKAAQEPKLADDLGFHIKPKRDRKTLLSLYGEEAGDGECAGGETAIPEVVAEPEASAEFRPEPAVDAPRTGVQANDDMGNDVLEAIGFAAANPIENVQSEVAPAVEAPKARPEIPADGSKKVLADVLGHGETLSDVYARSNNQQDVAGKIMNGKVVSIRTSIGINDKFLLIRDLFGGDSDIYDRTIHELDAFADLDDAVLYIHDNFRWNPDSEGAKLLMDLLTRKLS